MRVVLSVLGAVVAWLVTAGVAHADESSSIEGTFLQHGILGAIVLALGGAIIWQARELSRAKDARTEDAKKVIHTLLDLQEKWNTQVRDLSAAIDRLGAHIEGRDSGRGGQR